MMNYKAKKVLTVKELKAQLETMEEMGLGDCIVLYMEENSLTWGIEQGMHDIYKDDNGKPNAVVIY